MDTLEKAQVIASTAILIDFQNHEYRFTVPKSRTRLAEKPAEEVEQEHRQLQRVIRFTQTQQARPISTRAQV